MSTFKTRSLQKWVTSAMKLVNAMLKN